ncbi:MAG TPA: PilZ domain-containing protein [Gemmatimonadales bacterium]|nr:PilZ domain-containing protein [Gemmatimonadales bacterium]
MALPDRRSHERFPYAAESRPLLMIGDHAYEILDLGERGLRARCGEPERWLLGSVVEGTVWFQRDSRLRVQGTVVRAGGGELVLRLGGDGIPARALLDEIRYARGADG